MDADNKLMVIVKESGLEQTKANFILEKFQDYFLIADDWAQKAKVIIVTNASQKAEMEMARTGRLFLQHKRTDIEKARKELKEQSLREGKAIDGIANVLKALIIPIEEYLDQQEHYVEIKQKEEEDERRREVERRMEEERIAKEKAEAEERERIRLENIRLKDEAVAKEKQILAERAKAEAEKRAIEEKAKQERETERKKQEKILAEQKAKAEAERKALEEKAEAERKEKELLREQLENLIECPFCHRTFSLLPENQLNLI